MVSDQLVLLSVAVILPQNKYGIIWDCSSKVEEANAKHSLQGCTSMTLICVWEFRKLASREIDRNTGFIYD